MVLSKHGLELEMVNEKTLEIQADDLTDIASVSVLDVRNRVHGPLIVEDAGLFVEPLNGFPGPYSAYIFRTLGCDGILRLLADSRDRNAEFRSVIAYTDDKITPKVKTFLGVVNGQISGDMRGLQGFGFDPIFIPTSMYQTFAEMGAEEKNRWSHRAHALEEFASWYLSHT